MTAQVVRPLVVSLLMLAGAVSALGAQERKVTRSVATRTLARGDTLQASDIAAGEVLRAPAVSPPPVVTSGTKVTAIWQDGPVRMVITGVATNSAAIGAPVGVRIDPTRRLDGIAAGPNTVRLR